MKQTRLIRENISCPYLQLEYILAESLSLILFYLFCSNCLRYLLTYRVSSAYMYISILSHMMPHRDRALTIATMGRILFFCQSSQNIMLRKINFLTTLRRMQHTGMGMST